MENYSHIGFQNVRITGGFWKHRQDINRDVTAQAVYDRFTDTHRFDLLKCPSRDTINWTPHHFWDSDVAKWIEGAAYILAHNKDPKLEALCESAIDDLIANQWDDGYMNSYFTVTPAEERFTVRDRHELYSAGHLMEAACAYYICTGKDRFLKAVCRYADLIDRIFRQERSAPFITGGHPEVELALVRLYDVTGEKRYLELAKYFIDQRGNNTVDGPIRDWAHPLYDQSHLPLRDQRDAVGHAVRCMYIWCGAADIAHHYADEALAQAAEAVFRSATEKRMYITGGMGSQYLGEAFTLDYDLPNKTAYAETCAALAMIFFARRMQLLSMDSRYGDAIERVLYNGALSGVSLDGVSFFYTNPLSTEPNFNNSNICTGHNVKVPKLERVEVFNCSCCPPNLLRVIASIGDLLYSQSEDTLFVHQFMENEGTFGGARVKMHTNYPTDGKVSLTVEGGTFTTLAVRVPGWCREPLFAQAGTLKNGYMYMTIPESGTITWEFPMEPELMEADAYVPEAAGKVAVMRGPVVYCAEAVDNGTNLKSLALKIGAPFEVVDSAEFGIPVLKTKALYNEPGQGLYRRFRGQRTEKDLILIPYYAFANRGITEMLVWLNYML